MKKSSLLPVVARSLLPRSGIKKNIVWNLRKFINKIAFLWVIFFYRLPKSPNDSIALFEHEHMEVHTQRATVLWKKKQTIKFKFKFRARHLAWRPVVRLCVCVWEGGAKKSRSCDRVFSECCTNYGAYRYNGTYYFNYISATSVVYSDARLIWR